MRKNNEHAKDKMHVASRMKQLIVYSIENKLISGNGELKEISDDLDFMIRTYDSKYH